MTEAVLSASSGSAHGLDALFFAVPQSFEEPQPQRMPSSTPVVSDPSEDQRLCELIAKITQLNQEALSELYDATVSRVFGLARGITRNVQCAEEVTEDVYWQVWRQALRFNRQRGPVMAWLVTLVRSRAFDHLRRRDEAVPHPEPDSLIDDHAQPESDPAQLLSTAQRDRDLNAALERLDPLPRQLLSLAFFRGLTHDEIAQQTRLPLGSVKSHIRRALALLQRLLTQVDTAPEALT